jgi:hypothetical protein
MTQLKKLSYDTEDILDAFQLKRNTDSCEELAELLANTGERTLSPLSSLLEERRQALIREGDFWNEEELKMQFLAFLFHETDINEPDKIKTFYERPLEAVFEGYKLSVICDMLLATPKGVGKPKKPYFFLQEFKKAKKTTDAEGQMLTAMLIAQQQNGADKPVYGCWIQGKNWVFTVLHGKNYCISRQFDATESLDLQLIVRIFIQLKFIILTKLV